MLTVRSGANISCPIIGQLKKGDKVKIGVFVVNGWTNIYFGSHGVYVLSQYLK